MIVSDQVAVSDTAAHVITHPAANPYQVVSTGILVNQGDANVYLGNADVTTDNGFRLLPGAGMSLDNLVPNDLYAVAESAGEVDYLYQTSQP